jgi:aryl-alcohol dehydrogenase-like predicted oxidoreductase
MNLTNDISPIGFGTWGFSNDSYGKISKKKATRLLMYGYKKGINFIDTAPSYGNGRAEKIIGLFLKNKKIQREKIIIASKCGLWKKKIYPKKDYFDFSPKFINRQIMATLSNINSKYIDIVFLHSPTENKKINFNKTFKALEKLRARGLIREIGVSPQRPSDAEYFIENFKFKFLEINFNLIDQRCIDYSLFEQCKKKKIVVIARTPLNLGFLGKKINLTKIKKNNLDHRSDFKIEQLKLWSNAIDQFKILIKRKKSSIFSLRFCLSFYPVISAIPGMMNKKEISENASILKMKKVSFNNTVLLKCRDIYLKNNFIYNSLLKRN